MSEIKYLWITDWTSEQLANVQVSILKSITGSAFLEAKKTPHARVPSKILIQKQISSP